MFRGTPSAPSTPSLDRARLDHWAGSIDAAALSVNELTVLHCLPVGDNAGASKGESSKGESSKGHHRSSLDVEKDAVRALLR